MIKPKKYNEMINDMLSSVMGKTSINDLNSGSVMMTMINQEIELKHKNEYLKLVLFLCRIDRRFLKHIDKHW